MPNQQRLLSLLVVGVVAAVLSCGPLAESAFGANYISIDIAEAHNGVYTVAVNKAGEVAGSAAFLRHSDGTLEVFSVFNAANSSVWDMNEAGEIVGHYGNGNGHAFLRSADGTIANIDPPGATWAYAIGMSSHGTVVGGSSAGNYIRARDGSYTMFSADFLYPYCINDSGVVAGRAGAENKSGFTRAADGTVTQFDLPPAARYIVMGPGCIDDQGNIVARYGDSDNNAHGFIRRVDGSLTMIELPRWTSTEASSVDGHGVVVGSVWSSQTGKGQGFLYNPDGSVQMFHAPSSHHDTMAARIDGREHIVGTYLHADGTLHGYLRTR
ncbi:MAG: hypothetical protein ACJ8IR_01155 [Alphaproteobacteria bacterium]|jgi:hypothetical protein